MIVAVGSTGQPRDTEALYLGAGIGVGVIIVLLFIVIVVVVVCWKRNQKLKRRYYHRAV